MVGLLLAVVVLLLQATVIQAQETTQATDAAEVFVPEPNTNALTLTLSPISLLLETDPGVPVTTSFQVLNNSEEVEYLKVTLLKFEADETGSAPVILPFQVEDEYQKWLTVSPQKFEVEPNTWKTLTVQFEPPAEAALSYYYAIMVTRQVDPVAVAGETTVLGAPALLALTTVRSPLAKQELQLKQFAVTKRIYEFLPVEFEITVQNTGNIHLAPIGNIFVNDAKGGDVGQLYLNKANGLILPGSTRTYTLTWDAGFPFFELVKENGQVVLDNKGQPKHKLTWDLSKANLLRMGQFEGHLVFIYDNGERDVPTEATVSFWVIPWRILAVASVVGLLVLLGIVLPVISLIKRVKHGSRSSQKK